MTQPRAGRGCGSRGAVHAAARHVRPHGVHDETGKGGLVGAQVVGRARHRRPVGAPARTRQVRRVAHPRRADGLTASSGHVGDGVFNKRQQVFHVDLAGSAAGANVLRAKTTPIIADATAFLTAVLAEMDKRHGSFWHSPCSADSAASETEVCGHVSSGSVLLARRALVLGQQRGRRAASRSRGAARRPERRARERRRVALAQHGRSSGGSIAEIADSRTLARPAFSCIRLHTIAAASQRAATSPRPA